MPQTKIAVPTSDRGTPARPAQAAHHVGGRNLDAGDAGRQCRGREQKEEQRADVLPAGMARNTCGSVMKTSLRPARGIEAEGEHRGKDGDAREHRHHRIARDHRGHGTGEPVLRAEIAAVGDIQAEAQAEREERLADRREVDTGVASSAPVGAEQEREPWTAARQGQPADRQQQHDQREQRRNDAGEPFDAGAHAGGNHGHRAEPP
jgi:hypothetical protein